MSARGLLKGDDDQQMMKIVSKMIRVPFYLHQNTFSRRP